MEVVHSVLDTFISSTTLYYQYTRHLRNIIFYNMLGRYGYSKSTGMNMVSSKKVSDRLFEPVFIPPPPPTFYAIFLFQQAIHMF